MTELTSLGEQLVRTSRLGLSGMEKPLDASMVLQLKAQVREQGRKLGVGSERQVLGPVSMLRLLREDRMMLLILMLRHLLYNLLHNPI